MDDIIKAIASDPRACAPYRARLARAGSKRQVADIALSVQGIEYLAEAIPRGVVSAQAIAGAFAPFADGSYVSRHDGYTSALFVRQRRACVAASCALAVECPEIEIRYPMCEVHLCDCPAAAISGSGHARIFLHGSSSVASISPAVTATVK